MRRTLVLCLLLPASWLPAADKPNREIQELQRDMAQLQEMIKGLQQGMEQRAAAAAAQMQAVTASLDKVNANIAGVAKGIEQVAQDQDRKVVALIAGQGNRIDQAAGMLTVLQQAVADLTNVMNRLQTQVTDLSTAVKVMTTPAPRPPSAEELLKAAEADKLSGKPELALQEYSDFLNQFGDSPMADTAQFQIGMLHFQMKDIAGAAADFQTLTSKYPKSKKLPDALFYRAKILQSLHRAADAHAVCLELRRKFPTNDLAKQCE